MALARGPSTTLAPRHAPGTPLHPRHTDACCPVLESQCSRCSTSNCCAGWWPGPVLRSLDTHCCCRQRRAQQQAAHGPPPRRAGGRQAGPPATHPHQSKRHLGRRRASPSASRQGRCCRPSLLALAVAARALLLLGVAPASASQATTATRPDHRLCLVFLVATSTTSDRRTSECSYEYSL